MRTSTRLFTDPVSYTVNLKNIKLIASEKYNYSVLPGFMDFPLVLQCHRAMMLQTLKDNDGLSLLKFPRTMTGKKLLVHQLYVLSGLIRGQSIHWKNPFLKQIKDDAITQPVLKTPPQQPSPPNNYIYISLVAYLWYFLLSSSTKMEAILHNIQCYLSKIRPKRGSSFDKNIYETPIASTVLPPKITSDKIKSLLNFLSDQFLHHKLIVKKDQDVHEIAKETVLNIHINLVNYFYQNILNKPSMTYMSYISYVTPGHLKNILNGKVKSDEGLKHSYQNYTFNGEEGKLEAPKKKSAHPREMWRSFHSANSASSYYSSFSSSSSSRKKVSFKKR